MYFCPVFGNRAQCASLRSVGCTGVPSLLFTRFWRETTNISEWNNLVPLCPKICNVSLKKSSNRAHIFRSLEFSQFIQLVAFLRYFKDEKTGCINYLSSSSGGEVWEWITINISIILIRIFYEFSCYITTLFGQNSFRSFRPLISLN